MQFLLGRFSICYLFLVEFSHQNPTKNVETVFKWTQLEFDYPNPAARQQAIDDGDFVPGAPAAIDVDVYYRNNTRKIFVSIPRFADGNPVALGVVTGKVLNGNPVLDPYPSWEWHTKPRTCKRDRIISVYRTKLDECGRLWVLDTGRYGDSITCPPQILAFNPETDALLYRSEIPASMYEARSILVTPIVDVGKDNDTFIYIADCQANSIIVHDVKGGAWWRAMDKTLYPDPDFGMFNISGDKFDLMDGVLGMDLVQQTTPKGKKLFYQALSSTTLNWVYTSYLKNQSRFQNNPQSSPSIFHTYKTRRISQSAAMAFDRQGIAHFGLMTPITINCWNSKSYDYGKFIHTEYKNKITMQFASGVKVIANSENEEELWVVTSRFQKVMTGTQSTSEVNFRISRALVSDILHGVKCTRPNQ